GNAVTDNSILAFNRSDTVVVGGIISGSGVVNVNGTGLVILNNNNTYTGQTNINSGTVSLGSSTGLGTTSGGVVVAAGATLDLNGNGIAVGAEALSIQGTGSAGALAALQSNNVGNSSWAGVVTLA